jgi:two-component system, chemotaxis family, protein-glutamate methylesterase/glutaminase
MSRKPEESLGRPPTTQRDVVAIGASAGGLRALRTLVSQLPADFPAAILVVMHIGTQPSILPSLLTAWGVLPAVHAEDGGPLLPGRLHIAPPDHHLLVTGDSIRLLRGPKEHHTRPAIDPLFRSVAVCCGPRVVGIVLSGHLDDGTAGLQAIKACGGIAVVQDPREAQVSSMPMSALRHVDVDHCLPSAGMARLLTGLVAQPAPQPEAATPPTLAREHALSVGPQGEEVVKNLQAFADPSTHACPDCGGVLWEVKDAKPTRFRCHTGHAYTLRTLAESMKESTDHALQIAVRALQEQAILLRRAAAASRADDALAEAEEIDADAARLEAHVSLLTRVSEAAAVGSLEAAQVPGKEGVA